MDGPLVERWNLRGGGAARKKNRAWRGEEIVRRTAQNASLNLTKTTFKDTVHMTKVNFTG